MKSHDWFKSQAILSGGPQISKFCLIGVKVHWVGSATNRATPASFICRSYLCHYLLPSKNFNTFLITTSCNKVFFSLFNPN